MLMNVSNFWMLMNVAQTWHKRCTNSVNVQRFVQRLSNGLQAIFETSHKRIRCATVCATFDQLFASHFRISRISTTTTSTTTATTTTATTTTTTTTTLHDLLGVAVLVILYIWALITGD